ncbi:hypothetical protein ACFYLK_13130 [Proteus mirabilis]|uniref:hypothetical protein n=1 Tax=Proteus mirabilis TaxID=584 RepID=UPI0036A0B439
MSNYSNLERRIAVFLKNSPYLKQSLKRLYQYLMLLFYKKNYTFKSNFNIEKVLNNNNENFFGYYDKSPEKNGFYILHQCITSTDVSPQKYINEDSEVYVSLIKNKKIIFNEKTKAFNWQQGSKLQWLNDNLFIYNDINNKGEIISRLFDINGNNIQNISTPIYDGFEDKYFLSIDFKVLSILRPDYGYFTKNTWKNVEFNRQSIKITYLNNNFTTDLIKLPDLIKKYPLDDEINMSNQKFNHIVVSPKGDKFLFLHRYYKNNVRYDRFFFYSFHSGKYYLISDSGMISHYCWMNDNSIIVYMDYNNNTGYFSVEIDDTYNSTIKKIYVNNLDDYGDGHPTYIGNNKFITDTYPNKSRMKKLLLVDMGKNELYEIAEFYEPMKYKLETRCDLHPKWSSSEKCIYVDSTHTGKRYLYKIGPINV